MMVEYNFSFNQQNAESDESTLKGFEDFQLSFSTDDIENSIFFSERHTWLGPGQTGDSGFLGGLYIFEPEEIEEELRESNKEKDE
jgi:hypothetical protein